MTDWGTTNTNDWGQPKQIHRGDSIKPVDHQGNISVSINNSVDDNNVINDAPNRVNQQQVYPAAVKGRNMLPVQDDNGVILTVGTFVPDGRSIVADFTTTSTNRGMLIDEVYWQVYIDNKIPTQRMPQSISSALYPFYTWSNLYDTLGVGINNQPGKTVSTIQVRNAVGDGSTHLIIIEAYPRFVINGSSKSTS